MAAEGFKKVHFFRGPPVFTRQPRTQPGASWGRHSLLPLPEAAFDLWKAARKGKGRDAQKNLRLRHNYQFPNMLPAILEHFM